MSRISLLSLEKVVQEGSSYVRESYLFIDVSAKAIDDPAPTSQRPGRIAAGPPKVQQDFGGWLAYGVLIVSFVGFIYVLVELASPKWVHRGLGIES